jgi:hypothetical protein
MGTHPLSWALVAGALTLPATVASAADGPKRPDQPFAIQITAKGASEGAADSTSDVRKVVAEKKAAWFRIVETREEADLVLEIAGRSNTNEKAYVVSGTLNAANLTDAPIVGQCIPGVLDMHKPWKCAAENMAKRLEKFCRETYSDLSRARKEASR